MKNNAKIGGVLSIVSGAFGFLGSLGCICAAVAMLLTPTVTKNFYYGYTGKENYFTILAVVYIVMGIICALVGALAIAGGVCALKKKRWGWALAGAIGGMLAFFPCGIPALIFIVMGKPEFQAAAPLTPAPIQKTVI